MRQDGSFEARAAHNKSHHRPYGGQSIGDGESERERAQERHTRRGVTTISATRLCRLDGNGSCVDTSRDNRDTVRRHRCVSRAKLAAYLANGGPNGGMEGGRGGEEGGRSAAIGNVRRDSSPIEPTYDESDVSFPCLVLARNISAEERGGQAFIAAYQGSPRREYALCVVVR